MSQSSDSVQAILSAWGEEVSQQPFDQFFVLVYDDLRKIANQQISRESVGHTLSGTALVHETFMKLMKTPNCTWENRKHFFDLVAKAMRHALVDHARHKKRIKRGGNFKREHQVVLAEVSVFSSSRETVVDVDGALVALAAHSVELAKIVELRFFCNLTHQQIADIMDMSEVTVRRRWAYARAWLNDFLESQGTDVKPK